MEAPQPDIAELEAEVARAEQALQEQLTRVIKPEGSLLAWKASYDKENRPPELRPVMLQIKMALLKVFRFTGENVRGIDRNSSGRVHQQGAVIAASGLLRGAEHEMITLINASVALAAAEEDFRMPDLAETGAVDEEVATETLSVPAHHVHGQVKLDRGVYLADVVISNKVTADGMPLLRHYPAHRVLSALAHEMRKLQQTEPHALSMNLRGLPTIGHYEYNPLVSKDEVSVHYRRALITPPSSNVGIAIKLQRAEDFAGRIERVVLH